MLGINFSSAIGKINNLQKFIQGAIDYRVLPERVAQVFALILPWFELGLAIALILGITVAIPGILSALLMVCFLIAIIVNIRRGHEIECNCFGIVGTRIVGWGIVVRDILLLAFAIMAGLGEVWINSNTGFSLWFPSYLSSLSYESSLLIVLLLAFCFAIIIMVEWMVAVSRQIASLKNLDRFTAKERI